MFLVRTVFIFSVLFLFLFFGYFVAIAKLSVISTGNSVYIF